MHAAPGGMRSSVGGAESMNEYKRCNKCGETKPLSEFAFRKSGRKAGKPRSQCRPCEAAAHAEYRKQKPERDALYRLANRSRYAGLEQKRRERLGDEYRAYMREWAAKNRDRINARNAVNYAVSSRRMPPATAFQCVACGIVPAEQYHHFNGYGIENQFDVIPLCRLCHERQHHESNQRVLVGTPPSAAGL